MFVDSWFSANTIEVVSGNAAVNASETDWPLSPISFSEQDTQSKYNE